MKKKNLRGSVCNKEWRIQGMFTIAFLLSIYNIMVWHHDDHFDVISLSESDMLVSWSHFIPPREASGTIVIFEKENPISMASTPSFEGG